jgi:tetratricopeptide (TPR) repeat protein
MSDDIRGEEIRRWSDELARDPSSLVFLPLGELLRKQGQLDVALKIALRGLDRHQRNPEAHDLVARIAVDRRDFERAFGEWEMVLKIDPGHVGALKGLGYICFQQGRFEDAEQFLSGAAARGAGNEVVNALETLRRTSGGVTMSEVEEAARSGLAIPSDPNYLFAELLLDDGQTALLLDASGYVLAGVYLNGEGENVSQDVGRS